MSRWQVLTDDELESIAFAVLLMMKEGVWANLTKASITDPKLDTPLDSEDLIAIFEYVMSKD